MSRINTNVESLIARRAIGVNNRSLNEALLRLSTGLRINSGKDDPAGLIASETLRAGVRAISSAIDNANRADTIVAVAEGGLQEVSALLLELENLVDQSSSETGLTPEEVKANQAQIDAILTSIDRLADATAFGNKKLLNGSLDFTTSGINIDSGGNSVDHLASVKVNSAKMPNGAYRNVNIEVVQPSEFGMISAVLAGSGGTLGAATTIQVRGTLGSDTFSFASGAAASAIVFQVNSSTDLTGVSAVISGTAVAFTSTGYGSDAMVSVSVLNNADTAFVSQQAVVTEYGTDGTVTVNGANAVVRGLDASVRTAGLSLDLTLSQGFGNVAGSTTSFQITGGGAVFSISPDVGLSGQESIGLAEVSASKLGNSSTGFLSSLKSGLANDLSSKNFSNAQRIVRTAINDVASLRGRLGAFQKDTLITTINSLQVARENLTAAESAIRDADFAVETSNLTRAQILVSSSTSILQLANSQPQAALALLG